MEAIQFSVKKTEAYEKLQNLKEVNAPTADIEQATTLYKFWEVMEMEEGEDLGRLLMEFAILVRFDYKLIKPIANKDAGFWSDIENMGLLDFQLTRLQLDRTNHIISLLQSLDNNIKKLVGLFDSTNKLAEETDTIPSEIPMQWTDEELEKILK